LNCSLWHASINVNYSKESRTKNCPVVVRFAALGDVVLLTVLLNKLAERYGQAVALLSSGGWTRTLLEHDPAVAEVKIVRSRRTPYWLEPTQHEAVAWLRNHSGPVYLCDPDRAARRLVERAVPRDRIVFVWDNWPGLDVHWADWWYSVGARAPLAHAVGQPQLHLPTEWLRDAKRWLIGRGIDNHPLLLIQPGNKKTAKTWSLSRKSDKYWPVERWAAVIRAALQANPALRVVICGTPREKSLLEAIRVLVGDVRTIAAADDLPLPRLVALSSIAHSMISVDTGPAHVAAAMDCPCVVLFGRYGWRRWQPRAPNSKVIALGREAFSEDGSVEQIGVEAVIAAWRSLPTTAARMQVALQAEQATRNETIERSSQHNVAESHNAMQPAALR
jgi:heptosyltransferase III